jgi:hypothetical protein
MRGSWECHPPAVVVDGRLASCCAGHGLKEAELRAVGIGQRLLERKMKKTVTIFTQPG